MPCAHGTRTRRRRGGRPTASASGATACSPRSRRRGSCRACSCGRSRTAACSARRGSPDPAPPTARSCSSSSRRASPSAITCCSCSASSPSSRQRGRCSTASTRWWQLSPSANAAKDLLRLFRTPSAEEPAFRFGQASTRFLGDLYQDLYEDVRKRFALLQTPDFIESFILDRTLESAIERFGLDDTTLIDPTCGSGHFLLGAFDRLFEHRLRAKPGIDVRQAAHQALDAVYGADINPYAVAIARVRLTLSYLEKAEIRRLKDAPALPLHLVVADSLLYNPQHVQLGFEHQEGQSTEGWRAEPFQPEDPIAARDVLHRRYAAVVGNPPYITEKDSAKRESYRAMYPRSAFRAFSLAAPFCERFFQLARDRGSVGQITANSFMKREFGKKLIEEYLPNVNLELIVNTSGAYIPGHGTPTVLLFGTHEQPLNGEVLTVLAKRGEPSIPSDPTKGEVWSSIATRWRELGFDNDYITVANTNRNITDSHPWTLGGGGVAELKELLEERSDKVLGGMTDAVGRSTHTGEDGIFFMHRTSAIRIGFTDASFVPLVKGEQVRDWSISEDEVSLFPYDTVSAEPVGPRTTAEERYYWRYRSILKDRQDFGQKIEARGHKWFEHSMFFPERYRRPLGIAFAFVATHNHFVLDRGGKVFKQTAPIIKLPATATEDDHLALLAYLNSSTACFWMKQVFYLKDRASGDKSSDKMRPEAGVYEFTGTGVQQLPIPVWSEPQRECLIDLAREALSLAEQRDRLSAARFVQLLTSSTEKQSTWQEIEREKSVLGNRLVSVQEDIDWLVYELFGLAQRFERTRHGYSEELRPFVARRRGVADGLPAEWVHRSAQLSTSEELRAIEDPVFKRLWAGRRGIFGRSAHTFEAALRLEALSWLQEQAEALLAGAGEPLSMRAFSIRLGARADVLRVVAGSGLGEVAAAIRTACESGDGVPFLAAHCYSPSGIKKMLEWRHMWELQRIEDLGGPAPSTMPPSYGINDFQEQSYYRLRDKLDVPKERFILYSGCESDEDGEQVYGWAGWNHLRRAQALASLYQKRKTEEGWTAERLTPMLAGLLELLPWIKQWHNEPNAEFDGQKMGDYFAQFLDGECQALGLTHADLEAWRPTKKTAARKKAAVATDQSGVDEPVKPKRARKEKAVVAEPSGDAPSTTPTPEELG